MVLFLVWVDFCFWFVVFFFWDTEHLWGSHKFSWLSVTAELDHGLFYRLLHRAWSHQSPIKWITKYPHQWWALESPFTWDWKNRFVKGLLACSTEIGITTVNIQALYQWGESTLPQSTGALEKGSGELAKICFGFSRINEEKAYKIIQPALLYHTEAIDAKEESQGWMITIAFHSWQVPCNLKVVLQKACPAFRKV